MALDRHVLAPVGSTGNNTHAGLFVGEMYAGIGGDFVVEAVGATPTVTFEIEGSFDGTFWHKWLMREGDGTTLPTTLTKTAVGHYDFFPEASVGGSALKLFPWVRLITTANTNVTYSCGAYIIHQDSQ